jgi:hypothetical protein
MMGRNAMEIMWNGEKVTGRVLQVMIIAAIKWTLLIAVFIGQNKTRGGGGEGLKFYTHFAEMGKNFGKIT